MFINILRTLNIILSIIICLGLVSGILLPSLLIPLFDKIVVDIPSIFLVNVSWIKRFAVRIVILILDYSRRYLVVVRRILIFIICIIVIIDLWIVWLQIRQKVSGYFSFSYQIFRHVSNPRFSPVDIICSQAVHPGWIDSIYKLNFIL